MRWQNAASASGAMHEPSPGSKHPFCPDDGGAMTNTSFRPVFRNKYRYDHRITLRDCPADSTFTSPVILDSFDEHPGIC